MTRREFLRVSAVGAAGMMAAACTTAPAGTPAPAEQEEEMPESEPEEPVESPTKYKEAPELTEAVEAGELPSVEDRLPADPLVCVRGAGFEQEIGTYGGRMVLGSACEHQANEYFFMLNRDCTTTIPNIGSAWEMSEDGKTFTVHLRKGMKWSDGEPFTADDILFWWEDVVLNEELTAIVPSKWKPGGEVMKVNKIDDFTVELQFTKPYYYIIHSFDQTGFNGRQGGGSGGGFFLPKHYLKQFHIDYNPDADTLAEEREFDHWYELFSSQAIAFQLPLGPPVVSAWVKIEEAETGSTWERNPYYFKVDPEGNQLPYIDRIEMLTMADEREARVMRWISGQIDYEAWGIAIGDFPTLKKNEEKGGYEVWRGGDLWNAYASYWFNQTFDKDPELGEIFRDKRFRQALSMAIDRDEINERIGLGEGTLTQVTCWNKCPWFKEEWTDAYAEFNQDAANTLLDEMGLDQRDDEGFRLKPSGETLSVIIECTTAIPYWQPISEMVTSFWSDVGVRTTLKIDEWDLLWTRMDAGEMHAFTWVVDNIHTFPLLASKAHHWRMGWFAPKWEQWFDTNEQEGEEPPDEVKRLYDLCEQIPFTPEDEVNPIMQEIFDMQAENLYAIGTIGYVGKPCLANVNLGNVDKEAFADNADIGGTRNQWLELFYWKA